MKTEATGAAKGISEQNFIRDCLEVDLKLNDQQTYQLLSDISITGL